MTNPFLSRYHDAQPLRRNTATNLFWLLALVTLAATAILVLTLWTPGISGSAVPWILFLAISLGLFALLLLTVGQLRAATLITFAGFLLAVTSVSLLSRSGVNEMDLSQATVLFFLGLLVIASLDLGLVPVGIWVLSGAGVFVVILTLPAPPVASDLTVAVWNREFNPLIEDVLYGAGSMAGAFLVFQNRRNLQILQFDQEVFEATNQMLEQTVQERTQALRTILDSSGQGLLTFGADFLVEPEYSQGCRALFGRDIAGLEVDALLFPQGGDTVRDFRLGLTLYFAGKSRAAVIFDLLERETVHEGKIIEIDYREAGPGKLLAVLTDVTATRQLEERNRADEARRTLVVQALGNKRFFAGLLKDGEALFNMLAEFEERSPSPAEIDTLLAAIHTFKGNTGFFGFSRTQAAAHQLEFTISDAVVLEQALDFKALALDLKRSYFQELNTIVHTVGRGWLEEAGGVVMPREVYDKITRYVGRKFPKEILLVDVLEHYRKIPIRELFTRLPFIADSTAEKLGKRIETMEILGGELRVVPDRVDNLVSACVHIVNNMVDHGIELPYEREAAGKSPVGRLSLSIGLEAASVVLQFKDDGRGVNLADVEARARAKGLLAQGVTATPRELLQLLFAPGFSTRAEATEVSGRGIGLNAVRQEAEKLGGRVEVQSKPREGTVFEIILPLTVFANRRKRQ